MVMLLIKLIVCPLLVGLADLMMADVFFPSTLSVVLIGVVLAVIGTAMEFIMLRPGTLWLTTIADGAATAGIVYVSQFLIAGAYVSVVAALLTGGLFALAEYYMHRAALARMRYAR
jgi:hypothetical protein